MGSSLILAIDDEEDILELIDFNLSMEGFSVVTAQSGKEGLNLLDQNNFDLVLLDLMLPGMDGFDVTKEIRYSKKIGDLPIIMLTAKGGESDIVTGLELGADDYIVKPFSPRVLIARIKSLLRRKILLDKKNSDPDSPASITAGKIFIDLARYSVVIDNENIDLTRSEFEILKVLANKPGWVFTRSQIVDIIHGESYPVTDRSVDVQVVGLRKKLKDYGSCIETVRGIGYRFKDGNQ